MENMDRRVAKPAHLSRSGDISASEVDLNNSRLQIALAVRAFPEESDARAAFGKWMEKDEEGISHADRYRGLRDTKGFDFKVNIDSVAELDALVAETKEHPPHPTLH